MSHSNPALRVRLLDMLRRTIAALAVLLGLSTGVLAQSASVAANPSSFSGAGQQITITYTIDPGSYHITSIGGASQIKGVPISCTLPGGGTSSPFTCTSTYTVDALDDMSGNFAEFAVFSGDRIGGSYSITSPTLFVPKSGGGPVVMDVSAAPSPAEPGSSVTVTASISSMGCNAGLMPPGSLSVSIGSDSRTLPLVAEFPYSTGDSVSFTSGPLAAGTYPLAASYAGGAGCAAGSASGTLVVEPRPSAWVTSLGQSGGTLRFAVSFSAPVSGFTLADVTRTASVGVPSYALTGSGADYVLTVSNMTEATTVGVSVPANVASTAAGSRNTTSGAPVSASYTPPPAVASVSPDSGTAAGGDSVTITGQHFTGATGVTFGGVPATSFTVNSASSITATTPPAGTTGPVSVVVTTPAGSNAANTLFAYRDDQSISFTAPGDRVFVAGEQVPLAATATSGLTVVFSSTTPAVCSVAGTTATVLAGGTCAISADQPGNAAFNAAPTVQQGFVISPAGQSLSFTVPADRSFVANQSVPLSATATSGLAVSFASTTPAVCSVSGATATVLAAGTCTIQADQPGDASYAPAPPASRSFDIGQADQNISFTAPADQGFVANGTVVLNATASSGLAVTLASTTPGVCQVSGSTATILATGQCSIIADQGGDANHRPAPQVARSFQILAADQTIAFAPLPDTSYDPAGAVPLSATASSGLEVSFGSATPAVCSVTGTVATILSAGTCTVTADQGGDANFSPAPQVQQSFAIGLADQLVAITSIPPSPARFGGSYAVSATGGASGNPVTVVSTTPEVCTMTGSMVDLVGVGICTLQAEQAGDANHAAGLAYQTFQVERQEQVITFAPLTIQLGYIGGPDYTVSATGGASGQPVVLSVASSSATVCEIAGSTVRFIGGGTCRIYGDQAGTATYAPADQAIQDIPVVGNGMPYANAGPDQTGMSEGQTVTLDGSASFEGDPGQTLTYAWAQIAGPAVTLSSASAVRPSFVAPGLSGVTFEELVFRLTVSDGIDSASDEVSIGIEDLTGPGVTLSGLPSDARTGQPFTLSVIFSEVVTGFDGADLVLTNATLGGLSGSGASYTATVTPDGGGDVGISVPAGAATDLAGNPSLAASGSVTFAAGTEATELLRTEALARNRALLQSQPDLMRFLTGGGSGGFTFSTKGSDIAFDVESDPDRPLWLRLTGRWGTGDLAADRYVHGTIGTHVYRTETFILGAMLQGDHSEMSDGAGSVRASGWLAGPYVVARPEGGNLVFAASYLAGRTELSISPLGTYSDRVTSDRQLLAFSLSNEIEMGTTTLRPRIDLAHVTEDRPAYVDGLGGPVAAGRLSLTEASIGLDVSTMLEVSEGTSRLTGGLSAILSDSRQDGIHESRTRGRVSIGWQRQNDRGLSIGMDASYDGIGAAELGSLGVDFRLGLTF